MCQKSTAFPTDVTRLSPPPFLRREPGDEASLEPPVLYNWVQTTRQPPVLTFLLYILSLVRYFERAWMDLGMRLVHTVSLFPAVQCKDVVVYMFCTISRSHYAFSQSWDRATIVCNLRILRMCNIMAHNLGILRMRNAISRLRKFAEQYRAHKNGQLEEEHVTM